MSRDGANSRKNQPAAAIAVSKASQLPTPPNSNSGGRGGLAGLSTKANTGTTSSTARPSNPSAICQVSSEVKRMPIIVGWADSSRPTFVDSDMMVVGLEDSAHPTGFICCRQASHNNETAEAATTLTWSSTIHQSEIPEFWL